MIDVGVETGIIEKSGSWYSHGGERIGQGRENVKRFLKENPDLFESMYLKVRETLGLSDAEKDQTPEEEPEKNKKK